MVFIKSSLTISTLACCAIIIAALQATTSSAAHEEEEKIIHRRRRLGQQQRGGNDDLGSLILMPLAEVDTEAYLGRWYQTYASRNVKYSFELGGNCVTADYGTTDDDRKISVRNTVRPSGFLSLFTDSIVVEGFAAQSPTKQGQLEVNLPAGPFGADIDINDVTYEDPGNYWIVELGPINPYENNENKYSWSIVTNNSDGGQLYILVRDVDEFETMYEAEVLSKVEAYGFTKGGNRPRKTNQQNCDYST